MPVLDALRLRTQIQDRLVEFALNDNYVRDTRISRACERVWRGRAKDGGLLGEPWVEASFGSQVSEECIENLAAAGKFNRALAEHLGSGRNGAGPVFPLNRPLFTHQAESLDACRAVAPPRPGLVITAGTGAGKTEAFLLPILNELFSHERGTTRGVRAIFLYPLNALVNDQVERLHSWLRGQSRVSLFHFTSETPETEREAARRNIQADVCRPRSRKSARENPPDIVVTNYSMLEYMLCRPQDAVFFGDGLRAIVLDEAHLYAGTLAAEITLLLRRVLERCGKSSDDVLFMATSATLGGGLEEFGAKIFSKDIGRIRVIKGRSTKPAFGPLCPPSQEPLEASLAGFRFSTPTLEVPAAAERDTTTPQAVLRVDRDACRELKPALNLLVADGVVQAALGEAGDSPARLLQGVLRKSPLVAHAADVLFKKERMELSSLAKDLWGSDSSDSRNATIRLLQLGAAARSEPDTLPLLPNRIHLPVRPAEGMSVCLNDACPGNRPAEETIENLGPMLGGWHDRCPHCKSVALTVVRCGHCGMAAVGGMHLDGDAEERLMALPVGVKDWDSARILLLEEADGWRCGSVSPQTGELGGARAAGSRFWFHPDDSADETKGTPCPRCGENDWRGFESGDSRTQSILAESLLANLPIFSSGLAEFLPARGRRLLAFSDSRREAAVLGPRLMRQHETHVIRALLARTLRKHAGKVEEIQRVERGIARLKSNLGAPDLPQQDRADLEQDLHDAQARLEKLRAPMRMEDLEKLLALQKELAELLDDSHGRTHKAEGWKQDDWDANRREVARRLTQYIGWELASPWRGGVSLETLGLVDITYPRIALLSPPDELLGTLASDGLAERLKECWPTLLALLCDALRARGAVTLGSDTDDEDYTQGGKRIGYWISKAATGNFLAPFVSVKKDERRRAFVREVLRSFGVAESKVDAVGEQVLGSAFDCLLQAGKSGACDWIETGRRQARQQTVDALRIQLMKLGVDVPQQLFQCENTGQIWTRHLEGFAPEGGVTKLKAVSRETADSDPRYGRQRRELLESPVFGQGLWAEEHTAQLDPIENRRIQDLFRIGARNLLSSTTTLELGIDIGGLQAVFLANVPPGKANYLQRAGRAGRRADGSSLVMGYCRTRPFDRAVFNHFGNYLGRPLPSPSVLLERERIARRHVHAFLFGRFASNYQGDHAGAMTAFGRMGRFCAAELPAYWERGRQAPAFERVFPDLEDGIPIESRAGGFLQFLEQAVVSKELQSASAALLRETGCEFTQDWAGFLRAAGDSFAELVKEWVTEFTSLAEAWKKAAQDDKTPAANAIRWQLCQRNDLTVIEVLANAQFLPRYGFPIGVLRLGVLELNDRRGGVKNNDGRRAIVGEADAYRLQRPGFLAIGEYVPGSQLLVGGRLVVSRGVCRRYTGAPGSAAFGIEYAHGVCGAGHFLYGTMEEDGGLGPCIYCGAATTRKGTLLLPRDGFSSAAWDPPRASSDVERVGTTVVASTTFAAAPLAEERCEETFGGITGLMARYLESGKLLTYNVGENAKGFAICTNCGYSVSEESFGTTGEKLPSGFAEHPPLQAASRFAGRCWRDGAANVLRNRWLGAEQKTDVLLLDFSKTPVAGSPEAFAVVTTLGHALRIAGAKLLQLDTREIGVLVLQHTSDGRSAPGALFYDVAPGGAGHVRELLEAGHHWLSEARAVLYLSRDHDERCETACLDCLLVFEAQEAFRRGLLQRRAALKVLDGLLGIPDACAGAPVPALSAPPDTEWAEAFELLDTEWHPLAVALAEAGIPAPDDVHRDLTVGRLTTGSTAVMFWNLGDRPLAVVHKGAIADGNLVDAEPDTPPTDVIARLREHMPEE